MRKLTSTLLLLSAFAASPVMADPPAHAKAYGHHKHSHKYEKRHETRSPRYYSDRRDAHGMHYSGYRERDTVVVIERQHRPYHYIRGTGRYLSDRHFRRSHIIDRHDGIITLRVDGRLLHVLADTHHIIELIRHR
ncbi:hypothetical protein HHX48_04420 [Salinimonas sp. HHU 13199]|uniref:Uncharacterized protein n=1 Tax=Salinimonas profundi TaxID=2729140 RepID=A0ABR8LJ70_9ALTE|nr:hypothetical protein [Salinimonas profundi]MBD3584981.1 hypothetical protein [Salinimonas profundi]